MPLKTCCLATNALGLYNLSQNKMTLIKLMREKSGNFTNGSCYICMRGSTLPNRYPGMMELASPGLLLSLLRKAP